MGEKLTYGNSHLQSIEGIDYLKLDEGSYYKNGFAAGSLFIQADYKIIRLVKNPIVKLILNSLFLIFKKRLDKIFIPEGYKEELKGYSDSMKIPYNYLLLINLIYELELVGCSGFSFFNSDNSLLVAHNTDVSKFLAGLLLRYMRPLVTEVYTEGKNTLTHISFPFFCGALNGFNENGVCVTSHDSGNLYPKVVASNISAPSLIRLTLEEAEKMEDIYKIVESNFSYRPVNILFASEREHKFSILEAYPSDFCFTTFTDRSCVAVTNHYQSDKMRPYHKSIRQGSLNRLMCLNDLLEGKNNLSIEEAISILRDHRNGLERDFTGYSISNFGTFQSFVFDVTKGDVYISNGKRLPVSLSGNFIKIHPL